MKSSHEMRRMKSRVWIFFRWVAVAVVLVVVAFEVALRLTPFPEALKNEPAASTEFLDRNGKPLRALLVDERRFSRRCRIGEISPHMTAATLSAEDKRFRSHCGVDLLATARAVRDGGRSGASTITQQLVKLARPGPRTLSRKLAEVWLALRVERSWGKDRILAEYLNRLDYGNLQTGIASASRFYFL